MPLSLTKRSGLSAALTAAQHDGNMTAIETAVNTKVDDTDTRLSNARTPTAHQHPLTDLPDVVTALAAKATTSALTTLSGVVDLKANLDDTRMTDRRLPRFIAAARNPLATDDSASSRVLFDIWSYGSNAWMCTDNTVGAAVWRPIGSSALASDIATAAASSTDGPVIGAAVAVALASLTGAGQISAGNALLAVLQANSLTEVLTSDSQIAIDASLAALGYLIASATNPTRIRLLEQTTNGTNYVEVIAPAALSANYALTAPAKTGTLGLSTLGRHSVPILGASLKPDTASGPGLATYSTFIEGLEFSPTAAQYAYIFIPTLKSVTPGTFAATIEWTHPATTTNFGVVWEVSAIAAGDGDALTGALGTAVTVTDTGGTTHANYRAPETAAVTPAGPWVAGDTLVIRIGRLPANASDTMAVGALLRQVTLHFTVGAETDD